MTFTEKLDMLMSHRGINIHVLSKETGIPYMTIKNWYIRGIDSVKLSTVRVLASYFNVSLDFFIDSDPEPEPKNNAPTETGEGASENEIYNVMEELRTFLVRNGFIRDGDDLTEEQAQAILVLLHALFH